MFKDSPVKTFYINVCGIDYKVEIEEKALNIHIECVKKVAEHSKMLESQRKASKNSIKNSPLFKNRREWFIK